MRLLLDTHIALWAVEDNPRLSGQARLLIADESNEIVCSAASAWEVAIKHALHPDKMMIDGKEFIGLCAEAGLAELPIAHRHVEALETLSRCEGAKPHNDPFDKIMLAQAKCDGLLFLTHDSLMDAYEEPCLLHV